MPNFHKAFSSPCAVHTLRKSLKEAVCITLVIASLRTSIYPGMQRNDLHSGVRTVFLVQVGFPEKNKAGEGSWKTLFWKEVGTTGI